MAQGERERALRDREKRLKEEADRVETARRQQREEAARLQRERQLMEEREREEKKRRQEEKSRRPPTPPTRATPTHQRATPTNTRLGKRGGFEDSGTYDTKRHAVEDSYGPGSNIFGRLDPPSKTSNHGDTYRQGSFGGSGSRYGNSRGSAFFPMVSILNNAHHFSQFVSM